MVEPVTTQNAPLTSTAQARADYFAAYRFQLTPEQLQRGTYDAGRAVIRDQSGTAFYVYPGHYTLQSGEQYAAGLSLPVTRSGQTVYVDPATYQLAAGEYYRDDPGRAQTGAGNPGNWNAVLPVALFGSFTGSPSPSVATQLEHAPVAIGSRALNYVLPTVTAIGAAVGNFFTFGLAGTAFAAANAAIAGPSGRAEARAQYATPEEEIAAGNALRYRTGLYGLIGGAVGGIASLAVALVGDLFGGAAVAPELLAGGAGEVNTAVVETAAIGAEEAGEATIGIVTVANGAPATLVAAPVASAIGASTGIFATIGGVLTDILAAAGTVLPFLRFLPSSTAPGAAPGFEGGGGGAAGGAGAAGSGELFGTDGVIAGVLKGIPTPVKVAGAALLALGAYAGGRKYLKG